MLAYEITNIVNGKRYIGITVKDTPFPRWRQHLKAARRGDRQPLYYAIRKHGEEAFSVREIARAPNREALVRLERELIAREGTYLPNGYNATAGGDGGFGQKKTVSELLERRAMAKLGFGMHSDKAKAAASSAIRVHHNTPEYKIKKSAEMIVIWADLEWRTGQKQKLCAGNRRPDRLAVRAENSRHTALKHLEEIRARTTAAWADPQKRALRAQHISDALSTPESKAERSALMKALWEDPNSALRNRKPAPARLAFEFDGVIYPDAKAASVALGISTAGVRWRAENGHGRKISKSALVNENENSGGVRS